MRAVRTVYKINLRLVYPLAITGEILELGPSQKSSVIDYLVSLDICSTVLAVPRKYVFALSPFCL